MPFNATEVADRLTFALDPDCDFQSWRGIAADGNALRFSRMRSVQRRSWCSIDNADQLVRLTQGLSVLTNFAEFGDTVISTNHAPGQSFTLSFDHPVTGVGLDVEPLPDGAGAGRPYRVKLQILNAGTGETFQVIKSVNTGTCCFVGARSGADMIDRMAVTTFMLGSGGIETPIDFAVNRLELLAPVGNIV